MGFLRNIARSVGLDAVLPGVGSASIAAEATAGKPIGTPQDAPIAPTGADPAIGEAERREREAQLRARGRASTIATSGLGDLSRPSLARRTLLGF